jgi:hypothetical protein
MFQEADYFQNSTALSSLRKQGRRLQIRGLGNGNNKGIILVSNVAIYGCAVVDKWDTGKCIAWPQAAPEESV